MIERANSGGATASAARPTARTSLKAPSRSTKARPCRRVDRRARSPVDHGESLDVRRALRLESGTAMGNDGTGSSTIHGGCESAIRGRVGDALDEETCRDRPSLRPFRARVGERFINSAAIGCARCEAPSAVPDSSTSAPGRGHAVGTARRQGLVGIADRTRFRRAAGAAPAHRRSTRDTTFVARAGCAIVPWRVFPVWPARFPPFDDRNRALEQPFDLGEQIHFIRRTPAKSPASAPARPSRPMRWI